MDKDSYFSKTTNTKGTSEENSPNTDTDFVKCPSCGSTMVFEPKAQALVCLHCKRVEEFEKNTAVEELELNAAVLNTKSWEDETKIYRCENCGAKVVLEKNAVSGSCAFCGTSHVVLTKEIAGIKPNVVLPFGISGDEAESYAKNWSRKRIFAPKKFKKSFKAEDLRGIYTPNFTFDSMTDSIYKGRLGNRRTRTVGSGKNRRTETYIEWFFVSGRLDHFFDDVTVAAGSSINQAQLKKLSPFATEKNCVYEKKFLHGFAASHYEKDINQSWTLAKSIIDKQLRDMIIRKYHADTVDYLNVSTTHNNVTYKYVLMPVYVGNYKYNKKIYNIYINGSTGKTIGKSPISPLRLGLLILIIAAVIGVAYALIRSGAPEDSLLQVKNSVMALTQK